MSRSLPGRRSTWAGWDWFGGWGHLHLMPSPVPHQEHPFFTLHKTKKTDITAFVKEILGEDS